MLRRCSLFMIAVSVGGAALAAGDLTRQEPVTMTVKLGNRNGEHRFDPDHIRLETGKLYRLRLENAGASDYYFHSPGLADSIYSRKVVVLDGKGHALAEVYGPVRRLEIKAGSAAEWWFVPVRTGTFDDLTSTRTHTAAGMRGSVTIE